jgi:hypothetical protein
MLVNNYEYADGLQMFHTKDTNHKNATDIMAHILDRVTRKITSANN